jgi:glutathione S-transferase
MAAFELVSNVLCPHTQRAALLLAEKGLAYRRTYVAPADPPDWFKTLSPLGRMPLLRVDDGAIFEIGAICEWIEDTTDPKLLPSEPALRARHRMWAEFANAVIADIFGLYSAPDAETFGQKKQELNRKIGWLASDLGAGPLFAGTGFSLVDAAYAPIFRLIDIIEDRAGLQVLKGAGDGLDAYRVALRQRPSVREVVVPDYSERFRRYVAARGSYLSSAMAG